MLLSMYLMKPTQAKYKDDLKKA